MTYHFLQHYWWFIVSLLGAILVFLMFVQGANSMVRSLGGTAEGRRLVVNSTGRKWEFTFTTLVTFGGAFFASFPLFYSTSFGGAYWLWMIILFTFVVQAVSYEFQNKLGNILGPSTFQWMLVLNGILGPLLLGGAVATFFEGSNFIVQFDNLANSPLTQQLSSSEAIQFSSGTVSAWANASHGLDALLNPWVLILGLAVMFLARILGTLYIMNNVDDSNIRSRANVRLVSNAVPFVVLFVAYLVHLLLKDGYAVDAQGVIVMEPNKYLHNLLQMWPLLLLLLAGVALVLWGIWTGMRTETTAEAETGTDNRQLSAHKGIWFAGAGTILTVLALLLCAGWNNTAYYPSTADLQASLTIANSCSSEFTLRTMFYVSLLVPFVLAYIVYCWRKIDSRKITANEIANDEAY
jgi:cytochrome d ubiquinol oxidase subunit II